MKKAIFNFWNKLAPTKHENKFNLIVSELLTDNSTIESINLLKEINKRLESEFLTRKEFHEKEIKQIDSYFGNYFKNRAEEIKKSVNYKFICK